MSYNTTEGKKVQHQIERYAKKITKGLSKAKRKFISQMLFGMQASRDVKLSNVSRSLKEEIRLIKTENRLSNQIKSKDLTQQMNEAIIKEASKYVKEDSVLAMDLSDIRKEYAKKMDNIAGVWDGSKGEVCNGYWLNEIICANVDDEKIVPMYSEMFSQKAKGFVSENTQIIKAINKVVKYTKSKGIWVWDRGGDRPVLVEEFDRLGQRFVIRSGSRDFMDQQGRKRKIDNIIKNMRYEEKYTIKINKEGYEEVLEIELGMKKRLWVNDTEVSVIIVKGFGKVPMVLITNVDKTAREILEIYLTRWKCEETFRFLKQEYHLEDIRVRRYKSLRNTVVLLHAVFYFVSVYLGERLRMNILLQKILTKAKRFYEIPAFKHYAVADGIAHLLFNLGWKSENNKEQSVNEQQILLGFT
jgi:hypothetical protein